MALHTNLHASCLSNDSISMDTATGDRLIVMMSASSSAGFNEFVLVLIRSVSGFIGLLAAFSNVSIGELSSPAKWTNK